MRKLLEETGFRDVELRTHYRANKYFKFFFPLYFLVTSFENLCRALGWSYFSSGFIISGRK